MMRSGLAVFALVTATMLGSVGVPSSASAQVSVDINIGLGSFLGGGRSITCFEGERLIRARGFHNIRRVDCRGRHFIYRATRRGTRFEIALHSRDGRVVDFRRLRRVR
jgi:hypothetical protein